MPVNAGLRGGDKGVKRIKNFAYNVMMRGDRNSNEK